MSRRLSLAFLSAMFVYGLSVGFAPPARAANCDVNAFKEVPHPRLYVRVELLADNG